MRLQPLLDRMLAGDRRALARLMTLIENRHPETVEVLSAIHERCGRAMVIGITGPPGAGKSTLVSCLLSEFRERGKTVGVVAIDPSSPFTGGSVLGDRIRMQKHFLDEGVFIRSLSTRGTHGGLARATRHMVRLLDAFGKDVIVIETVGVGQTELDVMRLADTTVVVLVPEAGDTVQTMKAGLLEIADVFVVNKADREGANRIKTELDMMLHLRPASDWSVPVLLTQADQGKGVPELLDALLAHHDFAARDAGPGSRLRAGARAEFLEILLDEVGRRLEDAVRHGTFASIVAGLEGGELDPYQAALRAVESEEAGTALRGPATR
jgi:LAO/AO transport system kinase